MDENGGDMMVLSLSSPGPRGQPISEEVSEFGTRVGMGCIGRRLMVIGENDVVLVAQTSHVDDVIC